MPGTSPCRASSSTRSTLVVGMGEWEPSEAEEKWSLSEWSEVRKLGSPSIDLAVIGMFYLSHLQLQLVPYLFVAVEELTLCARWVACAVAEAGL